MSHAPRRRRGVVALAAFAGAAMILTACTSSPDAETSEGTTAKAPPLSIAAVSAPNSLDTAQVVDGQQMFVWASLYDTLLKRDVETGELAPNAASSWEYNEDGTELTLELEPDMTFSNGEPVNAEAVAATMLRTKQTPGIVQPKFALVEDVTAVDDLTVKVAFSTFDPQFIFNLALGAGAIGEPSSLDSAESTTNPVGSGPYTLDVAGSVPGTSYVMKKREDYWNADAFPFETFTVRVLQDPTASLNALQAGEINAATVQPALQGQLDPSNFELSKIEAQSIAYLDILDRAGTTFPALGDQRVRQAINHAIDRESILKNIYMGNGQTTVQAFNPTGVVWDEALNDTYEYDPELGRELVEEAGFAGETFKIPSTFLTTTIEPTLSQAFEDIGLKLEWVAVPPQQAQSALQSGEYGITFQITGYNSDPADAFFHYGENGFGNPMNYTDPELAAFFDKIDSTVEFDAALPTYRELNEYGVEQAYEAPIAFLNTTWATTDGISLNSTTAIPATVQMFSFEG
ncbi:ABC transporter substrate-binding protein [Microbacterium sp.]|uniref:ABC transporter substrate-binding protein n=1 Tax=Microbacterium sp. TaxID=51671 RepID=UPI00273342E1|nr:ABC transporter substrate-binding protein [Microbacterium sp.]MDP3951681.1 ABC transporter substrate-binding protein [Microbacterium sp.]